jgi:quercetin dioxygenase-like cupin family protein
MRCDRDQCQSIGGDHPGTYPNQRRKAVTMNANRRGATLLVGALAIAVLSAWAGLAAGSRAASSESRVQVVLSSALQNVPGSRLTALVVRYGPGEKSQAHYHAGSVFAYVLSGSIRSENSATGPARTYNTGEGFFEPVGSVHSISENASSTEPASLLAVFVAPEGAVLTTQGRP